MVLAIMPLLWLWSFYQVEKLRFGIMLAFAITGISIASQMALPWPYWIPISYGAYFGIPIIYIKKYSIEWNSKF